eukprot:TRINITY_DN3446_c0_g1_i1.p1 TRINITY_DN3446_c0_g1~~TRINITY_DN3446_c0_g1_i1.p1  ORF type:complete len:180 (-),score=20.97 TRINITY_DN3446_c0_g1_i1:149-688(-)
MWGGAGVKQDMWNKKGGAGKGGWGDGGLMAMVAQMLASKGGGGFGKGGGRACGKKGCKWCAKGECWGPGRSSMSAGKGNIDEVAKYTVPCDPSEVEAFLATHSVQPHAADKLRELDPRLQRVVIARGTMTDTTDQTAVLIMRCVRAQRTMPGDWICPGCNDLQFSKKVVCSKCGTPKPQ